MTPHTMTLQEIIDDIHALIQHLPARTLTLSMFHLISNTMIREIETLIHQAQSKTSQPNDPTKG